MMLCRNPTIAIIEAYASALWVSLPRGISAFGFSISVIPGRVSPAYESMFSTKIGFRGMPELPLAFYLLKGIQGGYFFPRKRPQACGGSGEVRFPTIFDITLSMGGKIASATIQKEERMRLIPCKTRMGRCKRPISPCGIYVSSGPFNGVFRFLLMVPTRVIILILVMSPNAAMKNSPMALRKNRRFRAPKSKEEGWNLRLNIIDS